MPGCRSSCIAAAASFKSQMKKADASGARYAVIVGDDEAAAQELTLKPLSTGEQQLIRWNKLPR